jgi:hypothetical protein
MRTRGPWLWLTVLLVGLTVAPYIWAADDDDSDNGAKPAQTPVSGHGIFNKIYDAVAGPPQPKGVMASKPLDQKNSKDPKAAKNAPKVTIVNASHVDRAQIDATYFRRLAVCDHLREIAAAKNDPALERQAEDLSDKAYQVYTKQLSHCSAQTQTGSDKPASTGTKTSAAAGKPATLASADKNSPLSANGDVR